MGGIGGSVDGLVQGVAMLFGLALGLIVTIVILLAHGPTWWAAAPPVVGLFVGGELFSRLR